MAPDRGASLLTEAQSLANASPQSDALLTHGVAWHRRMLVLGSVQPSDAVRHALAPLDLFAAVRSQMSACPDWLDPHEGQCCFYAATWIQQLLQASASSESGWPRHTIELLVRMKQPHEEPWAGQLASRRYMRERYLPGLQE